ncbi:MAG: TonB family protein [Nitrospira sp.]|nr:TonB family protein [Nitrospira sp.]MDR4468544.1 TonB family protein [Nitrospira sp.]
MNQVPMMQESRAPLLHGWVGSIALHSLLLLSLLPLFHRSTVTVPTEPFHWDVSLVQSIPSAEKSAQTIETPESSIAKQSVRTTAAPPAHQSTHHIRSFGERVASVEPQAEATVAPKPEPSLPPTDTLETESTATSTLEEPTPNLTQADVPPLQQAEPPIDTATQEPSLQETVTATAVQEEKSPTDAAESSPLKTSLSETKTAPPTRPDYSWLQQAIFRRLEELKRSSRPSFSQFEPLKVMVKAVVSRDGTLLDSAVVTSSGFARIDQEAMALVQRAFPMQFDRTVDRQQIVMRIPITYTRE